MVPLHGLLFMVDYFLKTDVNSDQYSELAVAF